jgi:DNA helicase-2/ATP-dependent DNA helicase PcrA
VTHPIVSEELELLERVLRSLAAGGSEPEPSEQPLVGELERIRELLVSGREAKDRLALLDAWQRGQALLAQRRRHRGAPRPEPASPYFAHLRLAEDGRERDVCLGRATWIRGDVRVVDWRHAPVARVFYRHRQGESYEERFGGRRVEGRVTARRTLAIRAGRLERVDAPEGSFLRDPDVEGGWRRGPAAAPRLLGGQGAALRAHGLGAGAGRRLGTDPGGARRRADKRLPEIAGLLDPEQYELIGRPAPGLLGVRGSAGSGKTTVALHRIAHLAYQDPRLDSARTLVLTFSPALRDYVGHVLPALGVERVRPLAFAEWAAAQRQRLWPELPRAAGDDAPAPVRRAKLHPALGRALARWIASTPGAPTAQQALDDWASVLSHRELLTECFAAAARAPRGAVQALLDWSRRRLDVLFGGREEDEGGAALDAEDDALLLRAWQLRVGPLPGARGPLSYLHLCIDEVQDFSPLALRVALDCAAAPRSVTLAGDLQQQLGEELGFGSWEELFAWLEVEPDEVTTLRVSYRSTPAIVDFGRAVLGPLREPEEPLAATREGPPVERFEFTDHGACVAFLAEALALLSADEPLASLAVLTPSQAIADLYFEGLERSEVPRLRRVRDYAFGFAPGVEVAEIDQARGLEFDYVVLADVSRASFPEEARHRRRLHVGATRAVHQLWVTSVGEPSPLLRGLGAAR